MLRRTLLASVVALTGLSTSVLHSAMIVDEFVSPGTAVGVPNGGPTGLFQTGLSDNVPDNTRRVYHLQNNGAFSNMIVGGGTIFTNNFGGSSTYFVDYGHLITGNTIGDLTAEGQDRFRLTLTNTAPTRGQGTMFVQIYNTSIVLLESQSIAIPQVGGAQTVDILFSAFTLADLTNVATVRLAYFGNILTDYSEFSIDRFETFGAETPVIPEPASLALLTLGAGLIAGRRRLA